MMDLRHNKILCLRPSQAARYLLLFVAGSAALLMAFEAARVAAVVTLSEGTNPSRLAKALALDPANPELHHCLGLLLFYSSSPFDTANGLWHLRRAIELDPNEALYWLDLASACEANQDMTCANSSFTRAVELSPMTPQILWSAANYVLRAGQTHKAVALFRRLLDLDSTYAEAVFRVCSRVLDSGEWTQASILNLDPPLRVALVNFLESDGQSDLADKVWRQLAGERLTGAKSGSAPFAFSAVEPYLNHLIDAGEQREAVAVWNDLHALGVITPASEQQTAAVGIADARYHQYIFNGGFEQTPLNAGFDWRHQSLPFASVTFSNGAAHSGSRAARIGFTGERNDESEPIFQLVPVQPSQSYLLTAFVRTEGITSDAGPLLRAQDPRCATCVDTRTEPTVGTTPWHQVRTSFTTGPETSLMKISVWRPQSRAFPFDIIGTFWLDDVSLTTMKPDSVPATLARAAGSSASVN